MALLKELFANIKEADISFSRGEIGGAPGADDDMAAGDDPAGSPTDIPGDEGMPGDDSMGDGDEGMPGDGEEGEDVIGFDVSAFMRVLEWAREEAEDDEAVHAMTEKLLALDTDFISMEDFEGLVGDDTGGDDMGSDDMPPADDDMGGDMPPEGEGMDGDDSAPVGDPKNDAFSGM